MVQKPELIVIVGPTASGKTALGVALAKRTRGEILSADSIQIYRELNIGSAKPTQEERQGIVHHLLDIASVAEDDFSVARFSQAAKDCMADVRSRANTPIVVGGTGLYINALTYPLSFTNVAGDPAVRQALLEQEQENPGSLYRELQRVDPARAAQIHQNDQKRIVRALEIYRISGQAPTAFGNDFQNVQQKELPYTCRMFGILMQRETLYDRIDGRVDAMMQAGLYQEARALFDAGYAPDLPAFQALGYKQLFAHFQGAYTCEEAVMRIKQQTRRFAKRQMTWFKRDTRIHWLDATKTTQELAQEIQGQCCLR